MQFHSSEYRVYLAFVFLPPPTKVIVEDMDVDNASGAGDMHGTQLKVTGPLRGDLQEIKTNPK